MRRDELKTAFDIQSRLLPDRCPQPQGFSIDAHQVPALEVGGDYYNFHLVGDGRLGIVIADVSGKGLKAALIAAMFAGTFRVQSWGNHNVRDVLARVNDFIIHALQPGMFITCTYGLLDLRTRRFTFARAGHEPLLLLRESGVLETYAPDGFALGMLDATSFKSLTEIQEVQLFPGDQMLLFTDGLTEAMNGAGEEFGFEGIHRSLTQPRRASNAMAALERAVLSHMGLVAPHDDRTLITVGID